MPDLQQYLGSSTWLTHHSLHLSTPRTGLAILPPCPYLLAHAPLGNPLYVLTASLALPFKPVVSVNSRSPQGRKSRVTFFPILMLPPFAFCICPAYFIPTPLPCMKPSSWFVFHSAAQPSACCLSFLTSKAGPYRAPASASHACSGPCFPEKGTQPLTWYSWVAMAWMEP